jgi:DNA-binding NtrC family response regulator
MRPVVPVMARILLVDDEVAVLGICAEMMRMAGHEAVAVRRGDEAISRMREQEFDLLISDLRMSPVSGIEVLVAARDIRPSMPVLVVTAYSGSGIAHRVEKLGACCHLTKPFRKKELLSAVDEALVGSTPEQN